MEFNVSHKWKKSRDLACSTGWKFFLKDVRHAPMSWCGLKEDYLFPETAAENTFKMPLIFNRSALGFFIML